MPYANPKKWMKKRQNADALRVFDYYKRDRQANKNPQSINKTL